MKTSHACGRFAREGNLFCFLLDRRAAGRASLRGTSRHPGHTVPVPTISLPHHNQSKQPGIYHRRLHVSQGPQMLSFLRSKCQPNNEVASRPFKLTTLNAHYAVLLLFAALYVLNESIALIITLGRCFQQLLFLRFLAPPIVRFRMLPDYRQIKMNFKNLINIKISLLRIDNII
jgi:hypothetical protein